MESNFSGGDEEETDRIIAFGQGAHNAHAYRFQDGERIFEIADRQLEPRPNRGTPSHGALL
jgi:hypothetical protein